MSTLGVPHWPVSDTTLAAALGTLGVELDPEEPVSKQTDTATGRALTQFWFRDRSTTDPERVTEHILGAWATRVRFELEHPRHPITIMRRACDARTRMLGIIFGTEPLRPRPSRGDRFTTHSLREAALLEASGMELLVFARPTFVFSNAAGCREILDRAARTHGHSDAQWMHRYLLNLDALLALAKNADPRLITRQDDKTLNLSADAPVKLRDQFFDLLIS
jgi:hypothetical protein